MRILVFDIIVYLPWELRKIPQGTLHAKLARPNLSHYNENCDHSCIYIDANTYFSHCDVH